MAQHLPEGTLLHAGSYRIIRFISSGGFGCTYEAEHVMLEKRVAIKEFFVKDFCNRDTTTSGVSVGVEGKQALVAKLQRKFIEEARGLCKLQHKGIVSVSDVFEENGTAYFVMDYVEGQSLSDRLKASGPLPEEEVLKYIRQVCDALAYVHANNRLHLDIKPGNIMIDGDDRAILIDFGASKQYDEVDGENTSTLMGKTPGYAPPEQMSNSVVKFLPATDIYALGATLYKLLTGITPPDALQRISGEPVALLPEEISAPTRRAVEAALLLDKTARPQTVADFLKLLNSKEMLAADPAGEETQFGPQEHVATTVAKEEPTELDQEPKRPTPTTPPVPPVPPVPPQPAPKKKWGVWIVAACVLIGIAVGFLAFRSGSPTSTGPTEEELLAQQRQDSLERVRQEQQGDSIAQAAANAERTRLAAEQQQREEAQRQRLAEEQRKKEEAERQRLAEEQRQKEEAERRKREEEERQQALNIPMVYVAGGTFTMGASDSDSEAYDWEKPAHRVTVSSFYIGKYEVTQAQWKAVMGTNPSKWKGDNLPVENVSWNDVQDFIRKLNAQTGKTYRLPTEAEWEFAARGGNSSRGYKYSGSNDINSVAWYGSNSSKKTHQVGTKAPNELGIYDMTGNVWEWCSDWYGSSYYGNSPSTNPKGPTSGSLRVLRGGSWNSSARLCRVSLRNPDAPDRRCINYGFRLVLDAQ